MFESALIVPTVFLKVTLFLSLLVLFTPVLAPRQLDPRTWVEEVTGPPDEELAALASCAERDLLLLLLRLGLQLLRLGLLLRLLLLVTKLARVSITPSL